MLKTTISDGYKSDLDIENIALAHVSFYLLYTALNDNSMNYQYLVTYSAKSLPIIFLSSHGQTFRTNFIHAWKFQFSIV